MNYERISFELFKSNVCHRVKELGDIEFIVDTLEGHQIRMYYDRKWYPESFYLLAMLDYISRVNNVPICTEYDDIRSRKLKSTLYPASVLAMCSVCKDDTIKLQSMRNSIPEFLRFNIVESDIRNIV